MVCGRWQPEELHSKMKHRNENRHQFLHQSQPLDFVKSGVSGINKNLFHNLLNIFLWNYFYFN